MPSRGGSSADTRTSPNPGERNPYLFDIQYYRPNCRPHAEHTIPLTREKRDYIKTGSVEECVEEDSIMVIEEGLMIVKGLPRVDISWGSTAGSGGVYEY